MDDYSWKTAVWGFGWDDLFKNDSCEQGNCSYSRQDGITLEIPFGSLSELPKSKDDEFADQGFQSTCYDNVCGFTQDGKRLVLLDVVSRGVGYSVPGGSHETLSAKTILASRNQFDPLACIQHASFGVEGLREWMNLHLIMPLEAEAIKLPCEGQGKQLLIYQSDRCRMSIRYGIRRVQSHSDGAFFPIYACVDVDYDAGGVSLDDFWSKELWGFQSFIAFCFGSYPAISWVNVELAGHEDLVRVYRGTYPPKRKMNDYSRVPMPYSLVKAKLPEAFSRWLDMVGDERQSTRMLASLLGSWTMPLELRFFAATSMFESLARSCCEFTFDQSDYDQQVVPLIDASPVGIRERVRGLLGLLKRPSYPMLIDAAYGYCGDYGKNLIPDWKRFRKYQIGLRHAGAHGLSGNKKWDLVVNHQDAQILLAYYIVMMKLGLGEVAASSLMNSTFMNASRERIEEAYALLR